MHRAWDETKHLTHELAEEAETSLVSDPSFEARKKRWESTRTRTKTNENGLGTAFPNTGRGDARDAGTLGTTEMTAKASRTVPVLDWRRRAGIAAAESGREGR